jgi:hypothetical protein
MTDEGDWRLSFGDEEQYYSGLTLFRRRFRGKYRGDHEHCALCLAKFMDADDPPYPGDTYVIVHEGYWTGGTTGDEPYWICDQCFRDFHERFSWKVAQDSN